MRVMTFIDVDIRHRMVLLQMFNWALGDVDLNVHGQTF